MSGDGESKGTIRSLDGTREITVEEFDRIADEGSDEIDEFLDWSKARRVRPDELRDPEAVYLSWPFTRGLANRIEAEATRLGVSASDLVARWLTERLDRAEEERAGPPHDHAAE